MSSNEVKSKQISDFLPESEVITQKQVVKSEFGFKNNADCTAQSTSAKSSLVPLIKLLQKEFNKNKLTYDQVKYVVKEAKNRAGIRYNKKCFKLPELPSKEEIIEFFNVISVIEHKLIFKVLLGTGLRIAELTNIKVSNIRFQGSEIFVSQGKGNKDRVVVVSKSLMENIQIYLAGRSLGYLFESNRGTKFTSRRIQQLLEHYRAVASLKAHLTCHTFRHLYITRLIELDVSRSKREILVGHSKGSQAHNIYNHLALTQEIKDELLLKLEKM